MHLFYTVSVFFAISISAWNMAPSIFRKCENENSVVCVAVCARADIMNTQQPIVYDHKEVINYQLFINKKLLFG